MGILESIDIEVLDMGETPVRMGGIKVLREAPPMSLLSKLAMHNHHGRPPAKQYRSFHLALPSDHATNTMQAAGGATQVYETREDNLITEGVLIFGSGVRARIVARVRIPGTGFAVSIPVEVSEIQVRS